MGNAAGTYKKKAAIGSLIGFKSENPFECLFVKKERVCLRETFQKLENPKEIVGAVFLKILNDIAPELKKVFGVERSPRAVMLKMPKLSGHVAWFTDYLQQLTTMLGYTENLLGAWQLVRRTGRTHHRHSFLKANQDSDINYFKLVGNVFIDELIPYLNGEKDESTQDTKKVRFASPYSTATKSDVWQRFFNVLVSEMMRSFEQECQKNGITIKPSY
ncbi:unnamed protein product [Thelazia callipaeda]|uniref:GLOBIN domain-containing protein n=1 Tax=Thelazia callipaeda TaxID=103827 RepID=A0A0N5CZH7_THECL|nr:unnamed protein product [Thelazia callipaeda]